MRLALLLFFVTVFSGLATAQKGMVASYQPATPPVIDGIMTDWETDWLLDPKGRFAYNIANDNENLYYRIKIVDDLTQQKAAYFGLSVLLNPSGKKPGKVGVKFPMGKDVEEMKSIKRPEGQITAAMIVQYNKDLVQDAEALELIGLAKENIVSSRLGLMNGIQVIIIADAAGDYLYEGKIPFKAFKLKKADIKVLGVSFQTGKLKQSPPANNNTMPPAGMGGGGYGRGGYGGGGYGGGYGGGFTGASMVPYNQFSTPTTMTIGVVLNK